MFYLFIVSELEISAPAIKNIPSYNIKNIYQNV